MTARYFLVALLALFICPRVFSQYQVHKIEGNSIDKNKEGIIYNLPRTGIRVDIAVKKTVKVKGPYSEFAEKYLGLNQVVMVNSTEYEIASIQLTSFSEPDPTEMYFIQFPDRAKDREALSLYLSELGTLVGIEGSSRENQSRRQNDNASSTEFSIPEMPNPTMFEQIDTVIRKISVDTITIEQKVLRKISSAKTLDQKAKEAADFILKLDESMFNLINGYQEVNYEKGTMEFMYNRMESLRDEYLQLFKGVVGTVTENYSFTWYPESRGDGSPVTLCRFSISKGILDKNSASGDLIQVDAKNLDLLQQVRTFAGGRNLNSEIPKGIYYRIPDEAVVSVKIGGLSKVETRMPVNQYGVTTFLSPGSVENIQLHDNTGGIKHVISK